MLTERVIFMTPSSKAIFGLSLSLYKVPSNNLFAKKEKRKRKGKEKCKANKQTGETMNDLLNLNLAVRR